MYDNVGTFSNQIGSFSTPGTHPFGITFASDKNHLWVTDTDTDYIYEIGTTIGNVIGSIPAAPSIDFPYGLAFASDKNRLWNTDPATGYIYEIGTTTGKVIGSFRSPGADPISLTFAPDKNRLWNTDDIFNYIYEIGTTNGNVLGSFRPPASNPSALAFASDKNRLWHSDIITKYIYEIGTTTGNVIGSFLAPDIKPFDLTFAADKNRLWNTDFKALYIFEIGTVARYSHIRDDAIDYRSIREDAVGSEHLMDNAVSYAAQIKDNIIGHGELTTGLQGTIAAGSVPPANSIGTTELANDSVGSQHIRDGAIAYGTQIKNDVIGSEHIASDAIGSSNQVGNNVIGGDQIIDSSVGYGELTSGLLGTIEDCPFPSGSGYNGTVTLTNAGTAYAVPGSPPTENYVMVLYNSSGTNIYWGYENSNAYGILLPTAGKVTMRMGRNNTAYAYCGSANVDLIYTYKEME